MTNNGRDGPAQNQKLVQEMNARAESQAVGRQLTQLRRIFENWAKKPATGADVAFAYITLCTAVEYTVGVHLRSEFEKLCQFVEFSLPGRYLTMLGRLDEHGNLHPYGEAVVRGTFIRLIQQEQLRCERLTFGELSRELDLLRGTTMPELCRATDECLWGDLQGLNALRNVYAHGQPLRIDEGEESGHNLEAPEIQHSGGREVASAGKNTRG